MIIYLSQGTQTTQNTQIGVTGEAPFLNLRSSVPSASSAFHRKHTVKFPFTYLPGKSKKIPGNKGNIIYKLYICKKT